MLSRNQRFCDSLQQENSLRNPAYDGLYPIPTLQEYIDGEKGVRKAYLFNFSVAKNANRIIGIYPEIKTPEFYSQEIPDFDFSMELANVLTKDSRFQKIFSFL